MKLQEQLIQFKNQLKDSQKIVFFGGAGVSTESGIPDFRSGKGLFMKNSGYEYPPEQIVSHSFFNHHPKIFFEYYFKNLVHKNAKPNQAHFFLAELERDGKEVSIITQNIDGLHQKAGSSKVCELHGSIWRNYCLECGKKFSLEDLQKDNQGIPRCPGDGAIVRPDVTLYEEQLDQVILNKALNVIREADMLIVAGTSLSVYPAAGIVDWFNGENFVVINKTPIHIRNEDALIFQSSLSDVFSKLN